MCEPFAASAAATSDATAGELREALRFEERVLENLRSCCGCSRTQAFFTLEHPPEVNDQKHALRQICRWTERNVRGILQHRSRPPPLEGQPAPPRWLRVPDSQSLHAPIDMQALLRLFGDVQTLDRGLQKKLLALVEHNYFLLQRFLDRFQRQDTDKPCEQALFLARSLQTKISLDADEMKRRMRAHRRAMRSELKWMNFLQRNNDMRPNHQNKSREEFGKLTNIFKLLTCLSESLARIHRIYHAESKLLLCEKNSTHLIIVLDKLGKIQHDIGKSGYGLKQSTDVIPPLVTSVLLHIQHRHHCLNEVFLFFQEVFESSPTNIISISLPDIPFKI